MYTIIETLEKNVSVISAVPIQWITGSLVLWPSKSKLNDARKKCKEPESSWKNFKIIRVLKENIGKCLKSSYIIYLKYPCFKMYV